MKKVYQVQAIDVRNNKPRIVHAYATEALAQEAIKTMKKYNTVRYIIVPVTNDLDQHWAVR